jgi:hypothetical protein
MTIARVLGEDGRAHRVGGCCTADPPNKRKAAVSRARALRLPVVLFAGLLLVALALASRADAFVYWANWGASTGSTIGRANLDGSGANQNFITGAGGPCGVAVEAAHV